MSEEELKKMIINQSAVDNHSFQEIYSWAEKYPYSTTIKVWLAERAVIENHPDKEKYINQASAQVQNRIIFQQKIEKAKEKQLVANVDKQEAPIPSEANEQHPLDFSLENLQPIERSVPDAEPVAYSFGEKEEKSEPLTLIESKDEEQKKNEILELTSENETINSEKNEEESNIETPIEDSETDDEYGFMPDDEDYEGEEKGMDDYKEIYEAEIEKVNHSQFTNWLMTLQRPSLSQGEAGIKYAAQPQTVSVPKELKRKETVASETLAILLAKQGHNHDAIEMYEKLKLLFPEKSNYFADKISNLR